MMSLNVRQAAMNPATDVESVYSENVEIQLKKITRKADGGEASASSVKARTTSSASSFGSVSIPCRIYRRLIVQSCLVVNHKLSNKIILFFLITIAVWLCCWILFGNQALPGGLYFSLVILFLSAHVLGFLFELIKLPSLLGMLITGIIFKNVPYLNIVGLNIDSRTSSELRNIAFNVILCRAGLFLDIAVLRKLKWQIIKFSVLPCVIEAIGFGVIGKFVLSIPFEWAFLLGFIVCGVSPAVVVPFMIEMEQAQLGTKKGIASLVIASCCFDNIIAITGHNLLFGVVFNNGALWWTVVQCPVQIVVGIIYGIVLGLLMSLFRYDQLMSKTSLRFIGLFVASFIALLGSKAINFLSAGPLGVLILAIVAKLVWIQVDTHHFRKENLAEAEIEKKIKEESAELSGAFSNLWYIIFLPYLYALIGNEIDFSKVSLSVIGLGVAAVLAALVIRMVATYFSVLCNGLNLKEKIFMCIAWIPKATVQAAIGSMALDYAKGINNEEDIRLGTIVVNVAVLSILLTAPLGTFLIPLTMKRLLNTG